jgi:hypothetical protein
MALCVNSSFSYIRLPFIMPVRFAFSFHLASIIEYLFGDVV